MNGNLPRAALVFGYVVTNLIKLGGLGLVILEAIRHNLTTETLALGAFMMAGATGAEALIDRVLGQGKER